MKWANYFLFLFFSHEEIMSYFSLKKIQFTFFRSDDAVYEVHQLPTYFDFFSLSKRMKPKRRNKQNWIGYYERLLTALITIMIGGNPAIGFIYVYTSYRVRRMLCAMSDERSLNIIEITSYVNASLNAKHTTKTTLKVSTVFLFDFVVVPASFVIMCNV